ncbi:pentatricopeptide repeat-containing protein At2g20710, mitochondrial-like [Hibiscus syriacus]|uniref:pentatricopeptide repeat-containing protein At2g20710, mitochondrial-like n=1 Tax=Hibiscus syriacus TaxID=106335 RepID=UPI001923B0B8|nr:pentatricopeptide repeat-containing protein At2g20710, mitochondrial-like [Hibiscus syriacus]
MSEEMKYNTSVGDMAVRLDFSKVHGMDQAEKYFNSLPEAMRTFQVHGALLNCYGNHKCLEKAGDTFRIMRESKLPNFAVSYNVMLNLYNHLGKHDKLDSLMQEMACNGIKHNALTNNIRLNAYASSYDIEGMEKLLSRIENDVEISMD